MMISKAVTDLPTVQQKKGINASDLQKNTKKEVKVCGFRIFFFEKGLQEKQDMI